MGMFSSDEDCWNHRSNNPYEELVLVLTDIFNEKDEKLKEWMNKTIERLSNASINDEKKEEQNERLIEAIYTFNNVFCSRLEDVKKIKSDEFENRVKYSSWARCYAFVVPQSCEDLSELIIYAKRFMQSHGCKMSLIEVPKYLLAEASQRYCYEPLNEPIENAYWCGVPVKVGRDYTVVVHWERFDKTESEKFWDIVELALSEM